MKPKNLRCPFTWEERRPLLTDGVLFVPHYYAQHDQWPFPGFNDSQVFVRTRPVYLEYCSGNGAWIIDQAKRHPEFNWVAVEKRFDRVRKIWSKMRNLKLDNLLVVCGEAWTFTHYYLPDNCLAGAYINFPDPWPKEKHAKNRLFQPSFVQAMSRVMSVDCTATIVTDDPRWTEQICDALRSSMLWHPTFSSPYYVTEWPHYGTSYFDELWREKGRTIHYMQFINKKVS